MGGLWPSTGHHSGPHWGEPLGAPGWSRVVWMAWGWLREKQRERERKMREKPSRKVYDRSHIAIIPLSSLSSWRPSKERRRAISDSGLTPHTSIALPCWTLVVLPWDSSSFTRWEWERQEKQQRRQKRKRDGEKQEKEGKTWPTPHSHVRVPPWTCLWCLLAYPNPCPNPHPKPSSQPISSASGRRMKVIQSSHESWHVIGHLGPVQ